MLKFFQEMCTKMQHVLTAKFLIALNSKELELSSTQSRMICIALLMYISDRVEIAARE